jgi:tagatose-1,6-bisphosphate aldolase non-catalytic subunit AgaZ/GatZ
LELGHCRRPRPAIRLYPAVCRHQLSGLRILQPPIAPLPLLLQYLPAAYQAVQQGLIRNDAQSVLLFHIDQVLARYAKACGLAPIGGVH